MYNTIGDVALTTIGRETKYFHDVVQHPKKTFFASPRPHNQHVFGVHVLNF